MKKMKTSSLIELIYLTKSKKVHALCNKGPLMKKMIIFFLLYSSITLCSVQPTAQKHDRHHLAPVVVIHSAQAVHTHPQQQCAYTFDITSKPPYLLIKAGDNVSVTTALKHNKSDKFVADQTHYYYDGRSYIRRKLSSTRIFNTTQKEECEALADLFSKAYSKYLDGNYPLEKAGKSFHFNRSDLEQE